MKFSLSLTAAAVLALCILAGCTHGTSQGASDTIPGTYLTVHFSHLNGTAQRAILPDIPAPKDFDGITLAGTRTDTEGSVEQKWTAVHDMENTLIPIEEGNWNFDLKLEQNGITVFQGNKSNINITAGENSLMFDVSASSEGEGTVSVTFSFPANMAKVTVSLFTDTEQQSPIHSQTLTDGLQETGSHIQTVEYIEENIPGGNYVLRFDVYSAVQDSQPAISYTETVLVIPSQTSSATVSLAYPEYRNITYHLGTGSWNDTGVIPYKFNTYQTVTLPDSDKLTAPAGYFFGGWYSNETCTGETVTSIPAGTVSNQEFWAKWIRSDPTTPTVSIDIQIPVYEDIQSDIIFNEQENTLELRESYPSYCWFIDGEQIPDAKTQYITLPDSIEPGIHEAFVIVTTHDGTILSTRTEFTIPQEEQP